MLSMPAVAIAVPVRNEALRLPRLLDALAGQQDAPDFTLCLFFDNCTDDSRAVVAGLAPTLPFAIVEEASTRVAPPNAGHARAMAGRLALAQSPERALLSTDADSEPASDWVAENLRALAVAEIIAGRPRFGDRALAPAQAQVIDYFDRLHAHRRRLDPVSWEDAETHHWTSAASLAIRPETYHALDGFASLPHGEDADLADRAWRAGHRVRRDARAVVRTSARRIGRAEGGFAAMLAESDRSGTLPRVSHPADEAWRYRHHALARRAYDDGDVTLVAAPLRHCPTELSRAAADAPNADAFAARVVGAPPGGMRQVPLAQAERLLDAISSGQLDEAA